MDPQRAPQRSSVGARMADRRADLATVHILKKELKLSDDEWADLIRTLSNAQATSSGALDFTQRAQLIKHCQNLKKAMGLHTGPLPQWGKLRALWGELHKKGLVNTNTEPALNAWAKAQANGGHKDSARWCNNAELHHLIESAKAWLKRSPKVPSPPAGEG